jgi:hypothetical protein
VSETEDVIGSCTTEYKSSSWLLKSNSWIKEEMSEFSPTVHLPLGLVCPYYHIRNATKKEIGKMMLTKVVLTLYLTLLHKDYDVGRIKEISPIHH